MLHGTLFEICEFTLRKSRNYYFKNDCWSRNLQALARYSVPMLRIRDYLMKFPITVMRIKNRWKFKSFKMKFQIRSVCISMKMFIWIGNDSNFPNICNVICIYNVCCMQIFEHFKSNKGVFILIGRYQDREVVIFHNIISKRYGIH